MLRLAATREVLYGPFDFVDTHGDQNAFRLGPDGWVYACHGFRNDSKVKIRGGGGVVMELQSGNTYRFRPDGSAIEPVTTTTRSKSASATARKATCHNGWPFTWARSL